MTAVNRSTLYTYFNVGDKPTEAQFANLIDSNLNLATTSAAAITADVSALGKLEVTGVFTVKGSAQTNLTGNTIVSGNLTVPAAVAVALLSVTGQTVLASATGLTRTSNDSSTNLATTAFVNPANSIGANGYTKLPSGVIIQWGTTGATGAGTPVAVVFPLAFPGSVFSITTGVKANANGDFFAPAVINASAGGFGCGSVSTGFAQGLYWQAVGN